MRASNNDHYYYYNSLVRSAHHLTMTHHIMVIIIVRLYAFPTLHVTCNQEGAACPSNLDVLMEELHAAGPPTLAHIGAMALRVDSIAVRSARTCQCPLDVFSQCPVFLFPFVPLTPFCRVCSGHRREHVRRDPREPCGDAARRSRPARAGERAGGPEE